MRSYRRPIRSAAAFFCTATGLLVCCGLGLAIAPNASWADDKLYLEIYDVSDLLIKRPDFPAPKLGLSGLEPESTPTTTEETEASLTGEQLIELIRKALRLDDSKTGETVRLVNGSLVVLAKPEEHAAIGAKLVGLRAPKHFYRIDARIVELSIADMAELKRLHTGKRKCTVVAKAKLEEFIATRKMAILSTPSVTVQERQVASIAVVDQKAYLKDFEVDESKQIADPVIDTLNLGLTLETWVKPLSASRRLLRWKVEIASAELPFDEEPLERGGTIELPQVEIFARQGHSALNADQVLVVTDIPARTEGAVAVLLLTVDVAPE
ncbi:MAG: hypothetical protein ACKVX7_07305 [Planctomycetota bacterium]